MELSRMEKWSWYVSRYCDDRGKLRKT